MGERSVPSSVFQIPTIRIFFRYMLIPQRQRHGLSLFFIRRYSCKSAPDISYNIYSPWVFCGAKQAVKIAQKRFFRYGFGQVYKHRHFISERRRTYSVPVFCRSGTYNRNIRVSIALIAYKLSDICAYKISLSAHIVRVCKRYPVRICGLFGFFSLQKVTKYSQRIVLIPYGAVTELCIFSLLRLSAVHSIFIFKQCFCLVAL